MTTTSERQAELSVQQPKTIVTYTNSNSPAGYWVTNEVSVGPVLDVLPTLSADTMRFDLALTASVTEVFGYDEPDQFGSVVPHAFGPGNFR